MPSILAVDAAWTDTEPSGVALVQSTIHGWSCLGLAPSYLQFDALARGTPVNWLTKPAANAPNVNNLLASATLLLNGAPVDVVTIDMPVAMSPIVSRRAADVAISKSFGGRGCSTHTPSATRPGAISNRLRLAFQNAGYPLATAATPPGNQPALVEVYPHPALLALLKASYRVPYKVARSARYLPKVSVAQQKVNLSTEWANILRSICGVVSGLTLPLPTTGNAPSLSKAYMKRYEDTIDALVCAWVGIQYVSRRCQAYGDASAAIWTP